MAVEGVLLSTRKVASQLALSERTVLRMIRRGDFPGAFRAGGRAWRIPEADLEAYVEKQQRERQAAAPTLES